MGIEPTYPAWKAGVLADVLHLQVGESARGLQTPAWRQELKERGESFFTFYTYYNKYFLENQIIFAETNVDILHMLLHNLGRAHSAIPIHAIF